MKSVASSARPSGRMGQCRQAPQQRSSNQTGVEVGTDEALRLVGLIERIIARNEPAFADFYNLLVSRVHSLATAILGNTFDADEVVVDIFSRIWEQPERYSSARGSVTAWVLMMTRSRAIDLIRKKNTFIRKDSAAGEEQNLHQQCAEAPEDMLDNLRHSSQLGEALKTLSEKQRQMLTLAFYRDMSHSEISDYLNMPLGTVKTHIRRALQSLKKHQLIIEGTQ